MSSQSDANPPDGKSGRAAARPGSVARRSVLALGPAAVVAAAATAGPAAAATVGKETPAMDALELRIIARLGADGQIKVHVEWNQVPPQNQIPPAMAAAVGAGVQFEIVRSLTGQTPDVQEQIPS